MKFVRILITRLSLECSNKVYNKEHDGNIFGSYVLFNLSNELKKNNKMGGVVKQLIVFLQQVY